MGPRAVEGDDIRWEIVTEVDVVAVTFYSEERGEILMYQVDADGEWQPVFDERGLA